MVADTDGLVDTGGQADNRWWTVTDIKYILGNIRVK